MSCGADVGDQLVRHAAAAQEDIGNLASRFVDSVDADRGVGTNVDSFETPSLCEIDASQHSISVQTES